MMSGPAMSPTRTLGWAERQLCVSILTARLQLGSMWRCIGVVVDSGEEGFGSQGRRVPVVAPARLAFSLMCRWKGRCKCSIQSLATYRESPSQISDPAATRARQQQISIESWCITSPSPSSFPPPSSSSRPPSVPCLPPSPASSAPSHAS